MKDYKIQMKPCSTPLPVAPFSGILYVLQSPLFLIFFYFLVVLYWYFLNRKKAK